MMRAIALFSCMTCAPSLALAERAISCEHLVILATGEWGAVGALSFSQDATGALDMDFGHWRTATSEIENPILLTQTSDNTQHNDRFTSVIVADERDGGTFVPVMWLIDWETPTLSSTVVSVNQNLNYTSEPSGQILVNSNYDCQLTK